MRHLVPMLAACLLAPAARAQMVLYDPLPPAGSAYVRLVNAAADALPVQSDFADAVTLPATGADRVGPYRVVEKVAGRKLDLAAAGQHFVFEVAPGSFNSLVLTRMGGQMTAFPIVERSEFNQARARLSFANVVPDCAAGYLDLLPDGPAVFADVAPGQSRMRNVNPVAARVRAGCGTQTPIELDLGSLEAGGQYSVWLMAPGASPIAFVARDVTAPYRR